VGKEDKKITTIKKKKKQAIIMVTPAFSIVLILLILPLIFSFYLSFRNYDILKGTKDFVGFSNYYKILQDNSFFRAIIRNLIYVGGVIGLNFLIGLGMALIVHQIDNKFIRKTITTIIVLPMMLIPASAAVFWRVIYNKEFGILNQFINFFGFERIAWLASDKLALYAVMFTDIWSWTPWMFLVLFAGLQNISREVIEAAQIDGASFWQVLRYITLPLLKPIIFIAIMLKSIDTFRTFDYVWIMTNGGPGESSQIIGTFIYRTAFRFFKYGYASSIAIVQFLIASLLSILFLVFLTKKEKQESRR
jgi:ABC-type sugar transport system permease subunit